MIVLAPNVISPFDDGDALHILTIRLLGVNAKVPGVSHKGQKHRWLEKWENNRSTDKKKVRTIVHRGKLSTIDEYAGKEEKSIGGIPAAEKYDDGAHTCVVETKTWDKEQETPYALGAIQIRARIISMFAVVVEHDMGGAEREGDGTVENVPYETVEILYEHALGEPRRLRRR